MIQRLIQILLVRLPFESKDVMNVTRDGGLSYETHAYNSTMDISFNENGMCLKPIRNPVAGVLTFSMGLLMKIYEYLGNGKMERREFKIFFADFQNKRNIAIHNLDKII